MASDFQPRDRVRFEEALRRFDEANAGDPNREEVNGVARPRELVYSEWLTAWVVRLTPDASEELRLAARSQHLCRWVVPRSSYPMTRGGYLKWREALKQFHAQKTGEILRSVGYEEPVILRVQALNLKRDFPQDPETRVLEDALCLVFLEHQLSALAAKASEEKLVNALRKSWDNMSAHGRAYALKLNLPEKEKALLEKALSATQ